MADIDKIVVTFVADATKYTAVIKKAQSDITAAVSAIDKQTKMAAATQEKAMQQGAAVFRAVQTPMERYQAESQKVIELHKAGAISNETYTRAMKQLAEATPAAVAAEKARADALQRGKQVTDSILTSTQKYRRGLAELNKLKKQGAITTNTYNKAVKNLARTYSTIGPRLKRFGAGIKSASASMRTASMRMSTFVTAPLTIFGGLGIKAFSDFGQQMANVSTMVDDTDKHMDGFREGLRAMSMEFGESTATLSAGLYQILSASIPAEKAMGVLTVATKAARAGMTDTETAADAITTVIKSYGLEASQAADVSDMLFQTVKSGKTDFKELASGIGKVASIASSAGISLDELGATIAVVTRAGIRTREAVTSINQIISSFLKPSDEAVKFAADMGDASFEMSAATLKAEGLFNIFKRIADLPPDAVAKLFPDLQAMKGVLPALKQLEGFERDIEAMGQRAGATDRAFAKMSDTIKFEIDRTKQFMVAWLVDVGEIIAPVFKKMMGFLRGAISMWSNLSKQVKTVIVVIGAIAAAIGPVLMVLAVAGTMLSTIVTAISVVASIGWPFLLAIAAIVAQMGLLATLTTAVTVKYGLMAKALMGPGGVAKAWEAAKKAAADFIDLGKGFFANYTKNIKNLTEWLKGNWKVALSLLGDAWGIVLGNMVTNFMAFAGVEIKMMRLLFTEFKDIVKDAFVTNFVSLAKKGIIAVGKAHVRYFMSIGKKYEQAKKAWAAGKEYVFAPDPDDIAKDTEPIIKEALTFNEKMEKIVEEGAKGFVSPGAGLEELWKKYKDAGMEAPDIDYSIPKEAGGKIGNAIVDGIVDAAKNAAADFIAPLTDAEKKLAGDVKGLNAQLLRQHLMFGKTGREASIYALVLDNAPPKMLKTARALDKLITAQEKHQKSLDEGAALTEKYLTPLEKAETEIERITELFNEGAIELDVFDQAVKDVQKSLDKKLVADFRVRGVDAVKHGSIEAMDAIEASRKWMESERGQRPRDNVPMPPELGLAQWPEGGVMEPGRDVIGEQVRQQEKINAAQPLGANRIDEIVTSMFNGVGGNKQLDFTSPAMIAVLEKIEQNTALDPGALPVPITLAEAEL